MPLGGLKIVLQNETEVADNIAAAEDLGTAQKLLN